MTIEFDSNEKLEETHEDVKESAAIICEMVEQDFAATNVRMHLVQEIIAV